MANQEEPLYLHNDVIEQILIHVPASSLLRFQLVCKNWRDMIQEPRFKKEHFELNNTTNEPLRLLVLKSWVINSGVICDKTFVAEVDSQNREIWIPRDLGNDGHFGGSCNGLLCTEVKGEITVFNPITREVVYLPKPTFIQGSDGLNYEYETMYTDFLFHSATGEYKVILFYQNCIMQLCAVHIYTLGANSSWRQIGNIGIFPSASGVNVEDTVYWPSFSPGYNGMIFFNLTEENINFIYFPINNRMLLGLTKWHGKLWYVCFQMDHRRLEFWIHGNSVEVPIAPSYEIQLQYGGDWLLAPYSIKMNRVFFVNSENSLICRDISGERGDFSVKYTCFGSICEIKNCFAYVESLLPVPIMK
ncbi:putative F-box/LRR-repeat/kelch-repeat protein At1g11620 [Carex rostrata]